MSREAHVRFDGSGEGKFLPATLPTIRGEAQSRMPTKISRIELAPNDGLHVRGETGEGLLALVGWPVVVGENA